ncbi:hypothetical protein BGZ63DRAFT_64219 [Mariannaea sp. PMI_226]|nr:hypothetical protein BGZ63DRAFT_64219 [Mariannaea sp. PMI_226]
MLDPNRWPSSNPMECFSRRDDMMNGLSFGVNFMLTRVSSDPELCSCPIVQILGDILHTEKVSELAWRITKRQLRLGPLVLEIRAKIHLCALASFTGNPTRARSPYPENVVVFTSVRSDAVFRHEP